MTRLFLFLIAFALGSASFSEASTSYPSGDPADLRTIAVDLPASPFSQSVSAALEASYRPANKFDFQVSSWAPTRLSFSSYIPGATSFGPMGIPALSFTFVSRPILNPSWGSFSIKVGPSFYMMARQATLNDMGAQRSVSQNLLLLPLRAGLEFSPRVLEFKRISGHFGLAALPTAMMAAPSVIGPQTLVGGMAYELSAGASIRIFSLARDAPELSLGLTQSFGAILDSDLSGFGAVGGIRFSI